MKRLALLLSALAIAPCFAGPPPAPLSSVAGLTGNPTAAQILAGASLSANPVTPNGASNSYSLGTLESSSLHRVPRTHLHAWKPYSIGQMSQDANGSQFNGQTAYLTIEVPDDVTAAQVILGNQYPTAYTISAGSIWGSSQLAAPGYTGSTYVVPYDSTGTALTAMAPLSFGSNGADSAPTFGAPFAVPANSVSLTTGASATSSGKTLVMATFATCPPLGSLVGNSNSGTTNASPLIYPLTTLTACNSSTYTLTLSQKIAVAIPAATPIWFAAPGIAVPANFNAPATAYTWSDWTPITTYPRLDGPIMAGNSVLVGGAAISGTVSSTTATAAVMSTNLASDIPPGTAIQACSAGTTNAAITPNYVFSLPASTLVTAGMYLGTDNYFNELAGPFTAPQSPLNTVASVAQSGGHTLVTMTNPLPASGTSNNFGSGTGLSFYVVTTASAASPAGQAVITVASAAGLSVGMQLQGNGVNSGTISSISGNAVTMSANNNTTTNGLNGIPSGTRLAFMLNANTDALATPAVQVPLTAALPNVYPGMQVVGANFTPTTWVWYANGTTINDTQSPTASVASGSTVYFCNNMTTAADSPAGQPNINFTRTTWPNRLVMLRLDVSTANANYYNFAGPIGAFMYNNIPGTNWRPSLAGQCTSEGVLNFAGITGTAGGCGSANNVVPYMIKFYSPGRGIDYAVTGDSHFTGTTTTGQVMNFVSRAAIANSKPGSLPIWFQNYGRPGQASMTYGPDAAQGFKTVPPGVAVIQYTTPNDAANTLGPLAVGQMSGTANALAEIVRGAGGLAVLTPDFQRQRPGVSSDSAANTQFRVAGESTLLNAAGEGAPVFDTIPVCFDPTLGNTFFGPRCSWDTLHWDDYAHQLAAVAFQNFLNPYERN